MAEHMPRQAEPEPMDDIVEARAYAAADFAGVNQAFADRMIEFVGPLPQARALDLGAGPADIAIRVARARPGWDVTAMDLSPAMLDIARQAVRAAGLEGRIELLAGDAKATDLPTASFDVIFSNSILHHITETRSFWREVRRIGRNGGWVFMRDLFRPASVQAAMKIIDDYAGGESELLREEYYRSLLSAYTPQEVLRQLADAGMGGMEVRPITDRHMDIFGRLA